MTNSEWTALVKQAAANVADKAYQQRSWFGKGPEVSSPDELFCSMFDDLDFDGYLSSDKVSLTPLQRDCGERLRRAMNRYAERTGTSLSPSDVINDPEWDEVRMAAAEFVRTLSLPHLVDNSPGK